MRKRWLGDNFRDYIKAYQLVDVHHDGRSEAERRSMLAFYSRNFAILDHLFPASGVVYASLRGERWAGPMPSVTERGFKEKLYAWLQRLYLSGHWPKCIWCGKTADLGSKSQKCSYCKKHRGMSKHRKNLHYQALWRKRHSVLAWRKEHREEWLALNRKYVQAWRARQSCQAGTTMPRSCEKRAVLSTIMPESGQDSQGTENGLKSAAMV